MAGEAAVEAIDKGDVSEAGLASYKMTIAALLLHRSTLHCYSAPWQTATP